MVQGTFYLPSRIRPTPAVIYSSSRRRLSFGWRLVVFALIAFVSLAYLDTRHQAASLAEIDSSLPSFTKPQVIADTQQQLLTPQPIRNTTTEPNWLPARLIINKINLDTPIVQVSGGMGNWEVPDDLPGTPAIKSRVGSDTNISVWGHRGTIFARLGEMQIGDTVYAGSEHGIRQYEIIEVKVITPNPDDGVEILPTNDDILTLVTCHPEDIFNERLIIHARLLDTNVSPVTSGFAVH